MNKQTEKKLVPKLRFPEFLDTEEWDGLTLGEISDRIDEKVGDLNLTTVSITAGVGFVSQAEKFSRDISGKQYKNYIVLREGDFAYNKGNSKKFPQGCIYKLKEFKKVAAPNAFICFRIKNKFVADFYQGYFGKNHHGTQLQKFITSGARMDGLLNIGPSDFFSIVFPTPKDKKEQQKIADCLSSIDDLINAHTQKLDTLKAYKKGLMQKLFPAEGETVPKLRFPEFRGDREWGQKTLEEVGKFIGGGTPNTSNPEYWDGDIQWFTPTEVKERYLSKSKRTITIKGLQNSSAKLLPKGTLLITTRATIGDVGIAINMCSTNQGFKSLVVNDKELNIYWYYWFNQYKKELIRRASGSTFFEIGKTEIVNIPVLCPHLKEQQKIADCLSSLDDLITVHIKKIDALKDHKKGLMQQLFPSNNEEVNIL